MRVAVCIPTFRRPEWLGHLLTSLGELTFASGVAPRVEIVVVDNDADQSAREVCERIAAQIPWPILYEPEPRRGISYVRNRALEVARPRAHFIAFVDDDEVVEPDWLDQLLRVERATGADVVIGPVLRRFECEVPAWVRRGEFFVYRRHATGDPVAEPATNNALVRSSMLEELGIEFDHRFALTGGEDTHFFFRIAAAGRKIVWADEAVVWEWIPASRVRLGWILQRIYIGANNYAMLERELDPAPRTLAVRMAKGLARIGFGAATLPFSWLGGRHRAARSLWQIWHGAGNIAGVLGTRRLTQQYLVHHGR